MYIPLPSSLVIKPLSFHATIHGYGLFTNIKLLRDVNLGISHVYHDLFEDGWIRTPLGGFYNYSKTPNCELRDSTMDEGFLTGIKLLYTKTDIEVGQELTCSYTLRLGKF